MSRLAFLLLFFCMQIYAEEEDADGAPLSTSEQIGSLNQETSYLIGGLISPLSGQVCLSQIDLIAVGAQSLALQRHYIAPYVLNFYSLPKGFYPAEKWDICELYRNVKPNYRGWVYLSHLGLEVKKARDFIFRVREANHPYS